MKQQFVILILIGLKILMKSKLL